MVVVSGIWASPAPLLLQVQLACASDAIVAIILKAAHRTWGSLWLKYWGYCASLVIFTEDRPSPTYPQPLF